MKQPDFVQKNLQKNFKTTQVLSFRDSRRHSWLSELRKELKEERQRIFSLLQHSIWYNLPAPTLAYSHTKHSWQSFVSTELLTNHVPTKIAKLRIYLRNNHSNKWMYTLVDREVMVLRRNSLANRLSLYTLTGSGTDCDAFATLYRSLPTTTNHRPLCTAFLYDRHIGMRLQLRLAIFASIESTLALSTSGISWNLNCVSSRCELFFALNIPVGLILISSTILREYWLPYQTRLLQIRHYNYGFVFAQLYSTLLKSFKYSWNNNRLYRNPNHKEASQ